MLVTPGVAQEPSVSNLVEIILQNGRRRVDITLQDDNGNPIDILEETRPDGDPKGELELSVTSTDGTVSYTESYWPTDDPTARRIKHVGTGTGKYYITFGTEANETTDINTMLFNWHLRQNDTTEDTYCTQVVGVVSPRILSLLPYMRNLIDKTVKPVFPEDYCYVGYTDSQLIMALEMGLSMINSYQPYPCWSTLNDFPIETHKLILLRAALYAGITSQLLFSIDTDVPSFSDNGHSFVLVHATPLGSYLNSLKNELDKDIPPFKRHFVNSGTIGVEMNLTATYFALLTAAPTGALFKGLWFVAP